MKNLWKKLYFTAGLLYTLDSAKRYEKTQGYRNLRKETYDRWVNYDLPGKNSFNYIWGLIEVLSFLASWPLWIVQVILDMTINK
jgi:hypothetical protein